MEKEQPGVKSDSPTDPEEKAQEVPQSSEDGSQPAIEKAEAAEEPQSQNPPKGFVPYEALKEEREKRKELEEQLAATSASSAETEEEEVYSDEGKELRKEIKALNERIRSGERKQARQEMESEFTVLKERAEDFDAFLEDEENKNLSIKKAAKLFLAENNLLASEPPEREGLERPTGGATPPPEPKLSPEEIANMMKTDWERYEKLLREGKI